jgi:hypothetical protein
VPRSVFTWCLGPFRWTPFHYDCISGYRRVFWHFWVRNPASTRMSLTYKDIVDLDVEEDF